ncbi:MAG: hypothetical protein L3J96_07845, partial [Thermoplasmata archaeon]|nr:hypothetical protein [Thermoplasmata archaeon]
MAYDPIDQEVVLFGGLSRSTLTAVYVLNDTWVYAKGNWTSLTTTLNVSPPIRYRAAVTFDAADGHLVMFGGSSDYYPAGVLYKDTWAFVHQKWTNLTKGVSGHPPARYRAEMTYDAADGSAILFGGCTRVACPTNDSWKFHGGHWTNLTASSAIGPSPRVYPAMAYDPAVGKLILFGGAASPTGPVYGDTWTFTGGVWAPLTFTHSPPGRYGADLVYDPAIRGLILFGGYGSSASGLSDTWMFT